VRKNTTRTFTVWIGGTDGKCGLLFLIDCGIIFPAHTDKTLFAEVDIVNVPVILCRIMCCILLVFAIVCIILSDRIDRAVNADKKLKKVIVTFTVGVILVCTIAIIATALS